MSERAAGEAAEADALGGVWAVVVNWNGGERNLACIESLVAAGVPASRVVFVDNASTDGSLAAARAAYPELPTIVNDANLGFGEGANQGARAALEGGARAVLFANNDVTFPAQTPRHLAQVLDQDARVGVVGPRVLYAAPPPRVWCAGGMLTWRQNLSTLLGHGQADGDRWQARRAVDYVAGCAMLVRREVFDAIGLLEPDYFAYMEDVDFCVRAKEAGFEVVSAGEVACHHDPSSATGGGYTPRRKYLQRARLHGASCGRHPSARELGLRFVLCDLIASLPLACRWPPCSARSRDRAVLAKALGILARASRGQSRERADPGCPAGRLAALVAGSVGSPSASSGLDDVQVSGPRSSSRRVSIAPRRARRRGSSGEPVIWSESPMPEVLHSSDVPVHVGGAGDHVLDVWSCARRRGSRSSIRAPMALRFERGALEGRSSTQCRFALVGGLALVQERGASLLCG